MAVTNVESIMSVTGGGRGDSGHRPETHLGVGGLKKQQRVRWRLLSCVMGDPQKGLDCKRKSQDLEHAFFIADHMALSECLSSVAREAGCRLEAGDAHASRLCPRCSSEPGRRNLNVVKGISRLPCCCDKVRPKDFMF